MSDLIKRDDVMKAIFGIHIEDIMTGDRIAFDKMLIEINKAVEAIPSVDAIQAIRCKDCVNRNYDNSCAILSLPNTCDFDVDPEDFCFMARKKE